MGTIEIEKLFDATIKKWGKRAQIEMMQEEAHELGCAARKHIRLDCEQSLLAMAREIADVEIMIEQMKFMFPSIEETINITRDIKLERLEKRVANNKFN